MNQKENQTPILLWIEKTDHKWLRAEAKKKKLSIAGLIRYYINYFRNAKKED